MNSKILEKLEKISIARAQCQRITNAPERFRVTQGFENFRLNSCVYLYIMYLEGIQVLHLVVEATRFSVAQFLESIPAEDIWESVIFSRLCSIPAYGINSW